MPSVDPHGQDVAALEGRLRNASAGMNAAVTELARLRRQLADVLAAHPSGTVPASKVRDALAGSRGRYRT